MNQITHKELTQQEVDLYFFYRKNTIYEGFFLRYFYYLPKSRTSIEAFNSTNDEYFDLFGEFKYSCMRSFRKCLKDYLNQKEI